VIHALFGLTDQKHLKTEYKSELVYFRILTIEEKLLRRDYQLQRYKKDIIEGCFILF